MPGKEKRIPKPEANFDTLSLIKFIPFLNCDLGKPGEMVGHIVSRMETWAGVDSDFVWRWAKNQEAIDGLRETQSDIRSLLVDPVNPPILERINRFIDVLSPVALPFGSDFSKPIMDEPFPKNYAPQYKCLTVSLHPRGSNRRFFMDFQGFDDFDRIWIPGFRAMIYMLVAEASKVATIANMKRSNVSFYIGQCPKCRDIFEKTRGNQVYCGFRCQSAEKQRRYDSKISR